MREKYPLTVLIVTTMIFSIISCKPTKQVETPPVKLLPAYTLNINYPSKEGFVTVEKGGSVTLPVTIRTLVDEPIKIRLTLTASPKLPEFIEYEVPNGYRTLNPGKSISTRITIKVSEDSQPGSYSIGIAGELQEPIEDRAGLAIMFNLTVVDRQS